MGQGCGSRADHPAAAADDRRLGRGVVRGAERRRGQQRAAVREHARHRVDRGDLQSRGGVEAGQHGGNPLGQHRLPGPRRAEQAEMMAARGADLRGPARRRLAQHVGQVGPSARRGTAASPGKGLLPPGERHRPRPAGRGRARRLLPPEGPGDSHAASRVAPAGSWRSAPAGRGPAPPRPRWRTAPRPAGSRGPPRPRRRAAPRGPGAAGRRARARRGTPPRRSPPPGPSPRRRGWPPRCQCRTRCPAWAGSPGRGRR